jgi:hypothetical protein
MIAAADSLRNQNLQALTQAKRDGRVGNKIANNVIHWQNRAAIRRHYRYEKERAAPFNTVGREWPD